MYIISKCLLGENCKYNGGNNRSEDVVKFSHEHSYFGVCPECAGGLPTPRVPAEIVEQNGECRVVNRNGVDVTAEYVRGAEICFRDAQPWKEPSFRREVLLAAWDRFTTAILTGP